MTRWVVTHINEEGLRRLTFAQQARYTYSTREEAQEAMEACRSGLKRVIGDAVGSLQVREVECWDHGDPKRYYMEDRDGT